MATKVRNTQISFNAPALPTPTETYSRALEGHKNSILRIYFSNIDQALRNGLQFDTDDIIDGSIPNSKLENSTVSYGGVTLSLGGSDATPAFDLSDATGYPTSSLVGTITNAQLAGSIANSKLANDSVSYGGVSLDLGQTDATPAFDLSDATNYPTSSLSGTITNAQLAGSIANAKLSNSTVSYGGVQLALGASDATPAFNLSDATDYPTSSLSGTIATDQIADDAVTDAKLADSINSAISANSAKVTNATHTGEVTGATALTIADNVVDEANLKVSNAPVNGYFLSAQSGNTGGLTWAQVSSGIAAVVDDTTPQLGGDLDLNSNDITGTGDISFTGTLTTDRLMVDHGSSTSSIMTSTTQTAHQIKFRAGFSGTQYSAWSQLSFEDSAGNVKGSITNNSFSTQFNTSSDYRLKEDIQAVPNATARTLALKPCNFQWVGSTYRVDGFLAHELAEQVPDAVTGDKDAVDSEGNPVYQGIDQSKIVPLLVKTIQELEARIAALEED